ECDFKGVPEPFSLNMEPPGQCSMRVFIVRKPDGKHDILKGVNLLGAPARADSCVRVCRGAGLIWRYGNQFRFGRLTVQYMLEKLKGYQLRYYTVVPKAGKGAARKTAVWELNEAGCMFMRHKGPRTNSADQFVVFADRGSSRPESPIFGWEESRIESALNNNATGRANARGLETKVLAIRDFDPWFLKNVIRPILALAFMKSRVEIELEQSGEGDAGELVPTIVTAKHDFFKGESATRVRPAIFDGGGSADQTASILRAFLSPSEEDAAIWSRWGRSEFDAGPPV
ncbi:unnamed protein product, partial [Prorocentrum cordatum]